MTRTVKLAVTLGVVAHSLGVLADVVLVVAVVLVAWLLWPSSLGGHTTLAIVSGHSMEPTYFTGDLVVTRVGTPAVGDIIVYRPKDVGGARVIHRIVAGNPVDGWTMKGDNNNFLDPWQPRGSEVLGIARLHLPHVGTVPRTFVSPILWRWRSTWPAPRSRASRLR